MPEVLIAEAPGGVGEVYECFNCGKSYLTKVVNEQGELTEQDADPPAICRRCGAPMDVEKAKIFNDQQAVKAAEGIVRTARKVKKFA